MFDFIADYIDSDIDFETALLSLLTGEDDTLLEVVSDISTFEGAGVMTNNKGLVVTLANGAEFQLTLVQSRPARDY